MFRLFFICSIFLCLLLLSSCGPDYIYVEKEELPESGWTYNDSLSFKVNMEDTLKLYNLYLELDYATDYAYQNLYLRMGTRFPNGKRTEEIFTVDLCDKMGAWYGKCNAERCKYQIPLQRNAFFNEAGFYEFTVAQHMRNNPLSAIKTIGLSVEDSGTTRKK